MFNSSVLVFKVFVLVLIVPFDQATGGPQGEREIGVWLAKALGRDNLNRFDITSYYRTLRIEPSEPLEAQQKRAHYKNTDDYSYWRLPKQLIAGTGGPKTIDYVQNAIKYNQNEP